MVINYMITWTIDLLFISPVGVNLAKLHLHLSFNLIISPWEFSLKSHTADPKPRMCKITHCGTIYNSKILK
jgi:hypothetical protein